MASLHVGAFFLYLLHMIFVLRLTRLIGSVPLARRRWALHLLQGIRKRKILSLRLQWTQSGGETARARRGPAVGSGHGVQGAIVQESCPRPGPLFPLCLCWGLPLALLPCSLTLPF